MNKLLRCLAVLVLIALAVPAFAQNAISAKAGLIQVADGEVYVNDQAIQPHAGLFADLKSGDTLRTEEGRVEVLLTPGSFLRAADSSAFRMVSNRLNDVQIDMLAGEAIVEVAELYHDNAITVRLGATRFELSKGGIYRFDAKPARLRVYSGEAVCVTGDQTETLRAGHEMTQQGDEWKTARFDVKSDDPLYRWSARRSESVAEANVSAARQAGYGDYQSAALTPYGSGGYGLGYGSGYGGYGSAFGMGYGGMGYGGIYGGSWMFNPYFGMYTFLPDFGSAYSPFGYMYYTPVTVVPVYNNAPRTPVNPRNPGTGNPVHAVTPSSAVALHTAVVTRGPVASNWHSGSYGSSGSGYSRGSAPSSASSYVSSSAPAAHSSGSVSGGGGGGRSTH